MQVDRTAPELAPLRIDDAHPGLVSKRTRSQVNMQVRCALIILLVPGSLRIALLNHVHTRLCAPLNQRCSAFKEARFQASND